LLCTTCLSMEIALFSVVSVKPITIVLLALLVPPLLIELKNFKKVMLVLIVLSSK